MLNAKNLRLTMPDFTMDAIRFGSGARTLLLLPGVGDGLKTVRGMALPFALLYRELAKDFTVYVFSRRTQLPEHFTTRDMARDAAAAMEALGLDRASVVGVSQGGMIAQWLALDFPEKVDKLVLTVTISRPNDTVREAIGRWLEMAARGDTRGIMLDTAERSYTPKRLRQARLSYGLLGDFGRPKSFRRFEIQARSCLTHDAWEQLPRIACPTLVIGGSEDRIVTGEASVELAARIPGSALWMLEGMSHGLYEEAPDFLRRVSNFCKGE